MKGTTVQIVNDLLRYELIAQYQETEGEVR